MKKLSKGNILYIYGIIEGREKPKGIYIIERGQNYFTACIDSRIGEIKITFVNNPFYGYVNHLGECLLNGNELKTECLIGEVEYSKDTSPALTTIEKLWNL